MRRSGRPAGWVDDLASISNELDVEEVQAAHLSPAVEKHDDQPEKTPHCHAKLIPHPITHRSHRARDAIGILASQCGGLRPLHAGVCRHSSWFHCSPSRKLRRSEDERQAYARLRLARFPW
eukprot:scaffold15380_cov79-Phaeocystis_antarctica.AAC.2